MKSLRSKLLLGFGSIILLLVILAGITFFNLASINTDVEEALGEDLNLLIASDTLSYNVSQRIALARGYVLFGDEEYIKLFGQYTEESRTVQDEILKLSDSSEMKKLVDKSILWRKIIVERVFPAYEKGNTVLAKDILEKQVTPIGREIMVGFEQYATNVKVEMMNDREEIIQRGFFVERITIILTIVSIVLALVGAVVFANMITKPILQVVEHMKNAAEGKFNGGDIHTKSRDEIGLLADSMNKMKENLRKMIQEVSQIAEEVSSQSEELTQSSNEVKEGSLQVASIMQELAVGAEDQANTASDLANTMSGFTNEIQQVNEFGESVSNSSYDVLGMTKKGSSLMKTSIEQMSSINAIVKDSVTKVQALDKQSQEISKLVDVIQSIADQTNLLALNAAIEAARAGENGRGFAVVADEVRKLAEQVSVSVSDITGIVSNIQSEAKGMVNALEKGYEQVDVGSNQIKVTGETFKDINDAVTTMVDKINVMSESLVKITNSTREMSLSVDNIASVSEESAAGVEQTSASVQQTTTSMEEVAANANSLSVAAEQLKGQVSRFRI